MHFTKLALIVEYDGGRYHGFQLQPRARTVQIELEHAVSSLTKEEVRVHCASRTDAGVHALGQVVSFATAAVYPPKTFMNALNFYLPNDIRVLAARRIPMDYDVRRKATSRHYRYAIVNRPVSSPILRERAYWVASPLDLESMNMAALGVVGERDFAPFCGPLLRQGASTIREVKGATFNRKGSQVFFEVEGRSFLPQQVRRMTGALLQVGLGKRSINDFESLAHSQRRGTAGPTLPPQGLYLKEVCYDDFPETLSEGTEDK